MPLSLKTSTISEVPEPKEKFNLTRTRIQLSLRLFEWNFGGFPK